MHLLTVFHRGHARFPLEITTEGGLVGKSQIIGDFLNRSKEILSKHLLRLNDDVLLNPVTSGHTSLLFDDRTEMLGTQTEEIGIEIHIPMLAEVIGDGIIEPLA